MIKSIAVFCGSSSGGADIYRAEAHLLGATMAAMDIELIYGGAKIGVMGAVADGCLNAGGRVTGIIPGFLKTKEVAHDGLTRLLIVETMHERKWQMHEMSDAVITLPGGWGTMEEIFEMLTWAQLGLHEKPIGMLNTNGYYNALLQMCDTMVSEKFLAQATRSILMHDNCVNGIMNKIIAYKPTPGDRILTKKFV